MPEEVRKKRYEWLDVLKFMGMLEIYIAHMGTVSGKLLPLMFVFNVQLFFFMSGLFARRRKVSCAATSLTRSAASSCRTSCSLLLLWGSASSVTISSFPNSRTTPTLSSSATATPRRAARFGS